MAQKRFHSAVEKSVAYLATLLLTPVAILATPLLERRATGPPNRENDMNIQDRCKQIEAYETTRSLETWPCVIVICTKNGWEATLAPRAAPPVIPGPPATGSGPRPPVRS